MLTRYLSTFATRTASQAVLRKSTPALFGTNSARLAGRVAGQVASRLSVQFARFSTTTGQGEGKSEAASASNATKDAVSTSAASTASAQQATTPNVEFPDKLLYQHLTQQQGEDSQQASGNDAKAADPVTSTFQSETARQHLQLILAQYKLLKSELDLSKLREGQLRLHIEALQKKNRNYGGFLLGLAIFLMFQGFWMVSESNKLRAQLEQNAKINALGVKEADELLAALKASLPTITTAIKSMPDGEQKALALGRLGELTALRDRIHTERVNNAAATPNK